MKAINGQAKDKRIEVYGESETLKLLADEIVIQRKLKLANKDYFLKVPFKAKWLIGKMGTSFELYLYMIDHITRPSEINDWWAQNVRHYFYEGYLPFAQHLDYMAEHAYRIPISVAAVSKQVKLLKELEVLQLLERVRFAENRYINIWSLGRNVAKQTMAGKTDYDYLFYFNMVYKKHIPSK